MSSDLRCSSTEGERVKRARHDGTCHDEGTIQPLIGGIDEANIAGSHGNVPLPPPPPAPRTVAIAKVRAPRHWYPNSSRHSWPNAGNLSYRTQKAKLEVASAWMTTVEQFIVDNGIDDTAAAILHQQAPDVQRIVLEEGPLSNTRNASAAIMGRIKRTKAAFDNKNGFAAPPAALAPPPPPPPPPPPRPPRSAQDRPNHSGMEQYPWRGSDDRSELCGFKIHSARIQRTKKRALCFLYSLGACVHGDSCWYLHEDEEANACEQSRQHRVQSEAEPVPLEEQRRPADDNVKCEEFQMNDNTTRPNSNINSAAIPQLLNHFLVDTTGKDNFSKEGEGWVISFVNPSFTVLQPEGSQAGNVYESDVGKAIAEEHAGEQRSPVKLEDQTAINTDPREQNIPMESEEVWASRADKRERMIEIVKRDCEYRQYARKMPKSQRGVAAPSTPDARARISQQAFEQRLAAWRRHLHDANWGHRDGTDKSGFSEQMPAADQPPSSLPQPLTSASLPQPSESNKSFSQEPTDDTKPVVASNDAGAADAPKEKEDAKPVTASKDSEAEDTRKEKADQGQLIQQSPSVNGAECKGDPSGSKPLTEERIRSVTSAKCAPRKPPPPLQPPVLPPPSLPLSQDKGPVEMEEVRDKREARRQRWGFPPPRNSSHAAHAAVAEAGG